MSGHISVRTLILNQPRPEGIFYESERNSLSQEDSRWGGCFSSNYFVYGVINFFGYVFPNNCIGQNDVTHRRDAKFAEISIVFLCDSAVKFFSPDVHLPSDQYSFSQ